MRPVLLVAGARPNFMKIAPLVRVLEARDVPYVICHTGQHYDAAMSDVFFEQLGIPRPGINLDVGSGTHAEQTARVMLAFEPVVEKEKPCSVVVVGDVNSTLACALVAQKKGIPVVHVEAGLRSFDRSMPEEVNRLLTDQLAELCLTPSPDADLNLMHEGVALHRIVRVGNIMIDTLFAELPRAQALRMWERFEVEPRHFGLVTLHRPSNVDDPRRLRALVNALGSVAGLLPLLWPVHPRAQTRLREFHIPVPHGLRLLPPLGYHENIGLTAAARLVLTDSGGMQEETTALGVPCLTLRETTERPITIDQGTNVLTGTSPARIISAAREVLFAGAREHRIPDLWDGRTAERVVDAMEAAHLIAATRRAA